MEKRVQKLRRKYEAFKKGQEDVLSVRHETKLLLEEAKNSGNKKIVEELEDILIDLEFSIEENICSCDKESSSC